MTQDRHMVMWRRIDQGIEVKGLTNTMLAHECGITQQAMAVPMAKPIPTNIAPIEAANDWERQQAELWEQKNKGARRG